MKLQIMEISSMASALNVFLEAKTRGLAGGEGGWMAFVFTRLLFYHYSLHHIRRKSVYEEASVPPYL